MALPFESGVVWFQSLRLVPTLFSTTSMEYCQRPASFYAASNMRIPVSSMTRETKTSKTRQANGVLNSGTRNRAPKPWHANQSALATAARAAEFCCWSSEMGLGRAGRRGREGRVGEQENGAADPYGLQEPRP
jgi:hypothetical protein